MEVVYLILNEVSNIMLPFGFSFGALILFIWTVPLLMKFFKSIF